MKNALFILNGILLLAVGVLFYLHFSDKKPAAATVVKEGAVNTFSGGFRIAYFEADSINNRFEMMKDVRNELSREEDKIKNENARLQKMYADRYTQYQNQPMSQVQSESASKDLMQLQESIRGKQQEMDQKFQDQYMRRMQEVKNKIEDFLKDYNKTRGYSYIFSNMPDFMYYKDTIYNITADLVKGLNSEYKKK
jgi:outer membrane protein